MGSTSSSPSSGLHSVLGSSRTPNDAIGCPRHQQGAIGRPPHGVVVLLFGRQVDQTHAGLDIEDTHGASHIGATPTHRESSAVR